ncbi:adenosine kinase-like [Drosophila sulfurigaster albostrigata]|uniref:adenosine kinase-like n=1 Tax=Drosophila sulfurigaster albostrigata TaxID=89887 RepID=UPI002D21A1BB|nr:adenosine kinase-like [Drosophila sulfurigaster albostrigata]
MKRALSVPLLLRCSRAWRIYARNMADIPEGILIGFGNPLLDITKIVKDKIILEKYGLSENAAIIAEEKHSQLFIELSKMDDVIYSAGGACQNSMRIFQWIISKPFRAYFVGAIGTDNFGKTLEKKASEDGVRTLYQERPEAPTGTCAVIVNGSNRSLVANLGASALFSEEWMKNNENMCYVKRAQYFYITGFFLAVNPPTVLQVARLSSENNRIFMLNFSAVFVPEKMKAQLDEILPYTDIVIGNKQEMLAYADTHNWNTKDVFEVGRRLQSMPKCNKRSRIVMITDAVCPVLCFQENDKVIEYPVPKVEQNQIVDTNGCGDAFVGGFLSQLVQQMPIDSCVRTGIFASQQVLRVVGIQIEKLPKFQQSFCSTK